MLLPILGCRCSLLGRVLIRVLLQRLLQRGRDHLHHPRRLLPAPLLLVAAAGRLDWGGAFLHRLVLSKEFLTQVGTVGLLLAPAGGVYDVQSPGLSPQLRLSYAAGHLWFGPLWLLPSVVAGSRLQCRGRTAKVGVSRCLRDSAAELDPFVLLAVVPTVLRLSLQSVNYVV